jgi:uncharacterized protein with ParB-like and HNH nuclease domain
MQVGTLAIQHLFEKDVLYRVPLYQRPYVWNQEEQWQPLWEDLQRLAETLLAGGQPRAHFLGASVQDRPPVPPGQIETRLLIDGQQRLTTIQLFLRAFEDVARTHGDQRYHQAIGKLIRNNHPLSTHAYESFKIWPTNADRDDFQTVMDASDRAALLKEYGFRANAKAVGRNIPDGYLFFHDAISAWLQEETNGGNDEARIRALYSAIRDNVRLVVIDLDEKDDAQLIFETLNARGTPLLSADLVKNSLLNEVQAEGGNAETAYQKYWQQFDIESGFWRAETGRGHAKRARIEIFLQHCLTLMSGDDVTAAHLYTAYRDFASGEKAGAPLDRLKTFRKYGMIYKRLLEGHDNPRVRLFLERLRVMDIGTAYPFLLRLFDVLEARDDLLVAVLEDLESFLVRRMVCRLSTRGYNRLFVDLVGALEGDTEQIPAAVRADLASRTAEYDRWPDDEEFRKAWMDNPLFENLTRPRLRILLEGVEAGLRDQYAETHNVPRNLTVEHVMPQSWELFWPLPGAKPEAEERAVRNRLIHTMGNLTLLNEKLNPAQSNKPWNEAPDGTAGKKEALREHSVLFLNKQLCDADKWDEKAIEARSATLFDVARQLWPSDSQPDAAAQLKVSAQ